MSSFGIRKSSSVILSSGSLTNIQYDPSSNWTLSGANIYNNNSGNVGIGTTGPSVLLDVSGSAIIRTPIIRIGVDAGLNNALTGNICIGTNAGRDLFGTASQNINIGSNAGSISQAGRCVAIGNNAGSNNQGRVYGTDNAIAIGISAAQNNQGNRSVCIGGSAGINGCGGSAVNLGFESGQSQVGENHVAIGRNTARTNQGSNAIAIGSNAGGTGQGNNSISIGFGSSTSNSGNSIMLNATGGAAVVDASSAFFVRPIDTSNGVNNFLVYNTSSGKISYNTNSTKTFVIDHPLDETKYLVHACLEGPEAGVYYRGEAEITNNESVTVALPDYTTAFSNFTIQVSPIGQYNTLYTSKVIDGTFTVYGNNGSFFWTVYATRQSIETEPIKSDVIIQGDGPYKYIV